MNQVVGWREGQKATSSSPRQGHLTPKSSTHQNLRQNPQVSTSCGHIAKHSKMNPQSALELHNDGNGFKSVWVERMTEGGPVRPSIANDLGRSLKTRPNFVHFYLRGE